MEPREKVINLAYFLGVKIEWGATLQPGDLYIAARNRDAQLLTCREVKDSYVVPVELAYCFDTWECAKVVS